MNRYASEVPKVDNFALRAKQVVAKKNSVQPLMLDIKSEDSLPDTKTGIFIRMSKKESSENACGPVFLDLKSQESQSVRNSDRGKNKMSTVLLSERASSQAIEEKELSRRQLNENCADDSDFKSDL